MEAAFTRGCTWVFALLVRSCGTNLQAPDNAAGRVFKCPKCGGRVQVPSSSPVSTAPQPAGSTSKMRGGRQRRHAQHSKVAAGAKPLPVRKTPPLRQSAEAAARPEMWPWLVGMGAILLFVGSAAAVSLSDPFKLHASAA